MWKDLRSKCINDPESYVVFGEFIFLAGISQPCEDEINFLIFYKMDHIFDYMK